MLISRNQKEKKLKPNRMVVLFWCFLTVALVLNTLGTSCFAKEDGASYPSKPITLICHFGAGGTTDLTARKLASLAATTLGQPIVVVNKPGGTGVIAASALIAAPPDGYTIGTVTVGQMTFLPHVRTVPFKVKEDFTWVMRYGDGPQVFVVRADAPWKTFKEFIEEARKKPGKMTYTTAGPMGQQHVSMELICKKEGVKTAHVPGAGGAEAITKLLGGHVDAAWVNESIPHLRSKAVRGLAVQQPKRLAGFPDIPTFKELGYEIDSHTWFGLVGPKGLDPQILNKLHLALKKAYDHPSFKELLNSLNMVPIYLDPLAFQKEVYQEYDRNAEALKDFKK